MVGIVLMFLIQVLIAAAVLYLVIWIVTNVAGVPVPAKIIQIVWVIFLLVVLLWAWQAFGSHLPRISLNAL